VIIDRDLKTDEIVARVQELSGTRVGGGPVTPGASTTTNAPGVRPRRANDAGQDVEVKPGTATDQKAAPPAGKDKKKDKKKQDSSTKGLRNPPQP